MKMPVGDWQFWVATAAFVGAALWLLRGVLPWSSARRGKVRSRRATLTVGGKPVDK